MNNILGHSSNTVTRKGGESLVMLKPFKRVDVQNAIPVVGWSEYLEIAKNPNSGEGVTWKAVLL